MLEVCCCVFWLLIGSRLAETGGGVWDRRVIACWCVLGCGLGCLWPILVIFGDLWVIFWVFCGLAGLAGDYDHRASAISGRKCIDQTVASI